MVWLKNDPCRQQQLKLGHQSSQYAEIAAILITLQLAASHNIKELLICTDSNYACLSFTCHLTGWKRNGFKTANNKPVKHQELFQASDAIVTEHDMIVYWKKVRGHSRQPGQDKDLNDQTDALAKAGALDGEFWTFHALPPNPSVAAVTRHQHASMPLARTPLHANYGNSYFRPINTSHFHLGPKHVIRARHAPLYQAHAASYRQCSHICP